MTRTFARNPSAATSCATSVVRRSSWLGKPSNCYDQRQHLLHPNTHELAQRVLASEQNARTRSSHFSNRAITAMRTRIHGDYHLGQVLFTGEDFVIIDFEGEPARSLSERRAKRSPLQDVAGMLRSFHYAAYAPLVGDPAKTGELEAIGAARALLADMGFSGFLAGRTWTSPEMPDTFPVARSNLQTLLDAYLLDKAMYELRYELNNRPHWVAIPLEGIAPLLSAE